MTDDDQRYLTAIHEAGHAIAGQALGFTVHEVTVQDGPGGGTCAADVERPHGTLDAIQRDLSYTLAGRLAVALERQDDLERFSSGEIGGPLYNTLELEKGSMDGMGTGMGYRDYVTAAGAFLGDDLAAYGWMDRALPAAAKETLRILRERWNDVQSLAIRLNARGEVDLGEKVRQARLRKEIARVEASLAKRRPRVGARR